MLVGLLVLQLGEALGDHAEAPRVDADHVDGRLALDHPLGQLPAAAAGRGDAEGMSLGEPEVGQAEGRADHGIAVRGVGDGAVDDVLDAGVLEAGHAGHAGLDVRHQALEIAGEEVLLEAGRHAVGEARRGALLVGAEDPAHPFFPEVVLGVGFAQDRQLRVAGLAVVLQHRVDVGDDVLVLDRDRGDLKADHLGGGAGVVAGGADHVLAGDVALGGLDDPLQALAALDAGDLGLLVDLGAVLAGALGQGHGDVDRRDMAVGRVPERADQAVHGGERPELLDLLDADQVALDADGLGRALVVAVLVHAVAVGRQAQVAGVVEAHGLAGLGLQLLVELDRVLVELADAVAHVEERQQAGGVPGRAGGQLGPLEQDHVVPALLGQVIEDADAVDAAADDNHAGMAFHAESPRCRPLSAARPPQAGFLS